MKQELSQSELEELTELLQAVGKFMACFEAVFHEDWVYSKVCLSDQNIDDCIPGTFLEPGVDEHSNWSNRGELLESYRRLKTLFTFFAWGGETKGEQGPT